MEVIETTLEAGQLSLDAGLRLLDRGFGVLYYRAKDGTIQVCALEDGKAFTYVKGSGAFGVHFRK